MISLVNIDIWPDLRQSSPTRELHFPWNTSLLILPYGVLQPPCSWTLFLPLITRQWILQYKSGHWTLVYRFLLCNHWSNYYNDVHDDPNIQSDLVMAVKDDSPVVCCSDALVGQWILHCPVDVHSVVDALLISLPLLNDDNDIDSFLRCHFCLVPKPL